MLLQITGIEKNSTSTTVVDSFTFTANVKDSVADFFTIIANSMISDMTVEENGGYSDNKPSKDTVFVIHEINHGSMCTRK